MSPGMLRSATVDRLRLRSVKGQLATLVVVKATVIVVAVAVLIATVVPSDSASTRARTLNQAGAQIAITLAHLADQQNGLRGYLLSGDRQLVATLESGPPAFAGDVGTLRPLLVEIGESTAPLDGFLTSYQTWYRADVVPEIALVDVGQVARARAGEVGLLGQSLYDDVRSRGVAIAKHLVAAYTSALALASSLHDRVVWLVVALLMMLVGALVVASLIVRVAVVRPLANMRAVARRVADGAWDDVVMVRGPTEITALAVDVDRMRLALVQGVENERRAAEALDQNGPAVVALRRSLEPSPWNDDSFEAHGRLDPAEGVLAGDWYDVVRLDDDRVATILGDVAGHGARSGVYALRLKGMLRRAMIDGRSPGDALAGLARHIARFPDDERVASGELFATVFVAVADRRTGSISYASAGHLDAVLLRAVPHVGLAPLHYDRINLPPTGPMLSALLADRAWTERRHRFDRDDVLVAATDGVIEARDDQGIDEFGADRLVRTLSDRLVAGDPIPQAVATLFHEIHRFEQKARDDRTLVVLRHSGTRTRFASARVTSVAPIRPN